MLSSNDIRVKYSNDHDLGKYFRLNFHLIEELSMNESMQIIKDTPNDYLLGAYIRHRLNEL